MSLGTRLKYQREKRNWSQKFVAEKIGITNTVLSNYERDYRDPDTDNLKKLSELYGVSTDYLLGLTDKENYCDEIKIVVDKFLNARNENDQEIREFMYLIMSEPPEERERLYRLIQAYLEKN